MLKNFLPVIADVVPGAVLLLPPLLLWLFGTSNGRRHSGAQKTGLTLLTLYLLAVCSVVGIPAVKYLRLDFSFNLLPLLDMVNDPLRSTLQNILNVILFVPLGVLLPAVWPYYRSLRRTALAGLGFSLSIELLQMFCWRLTDVDDLLTNTLGAVLGFYLWQFCFKRLHSKAQAGQGEPSAQEPWLLWLACLLVTIFVQPFLPEPLRNWFLYTPFWQ